VKFCVKCGRVVDAEHYISKYSVCVDCYLKYYGVFTEKPVLNIVICPKCGSWRLSGEWIESKPFNEILKQVFMLNSSKFLDRDVEVIDLDIIGEPRSIQRNRFRVKALLRAVINGVKLKDIVFELEYVLEKKTCPRCIEFASRKHEVLIQIRSERGWLYESEKEMVMSILNNETFVNDIVEIVDGKNGLDVKFRTLHIGRKVAQLISKNTGAHIMETFKTTRYDSSRGKWRGVVTISLRLPSINPGEIVVYKNRPVVIRSVDVNGIIIEFIDDGSVELVKYGEYWNGVLKDSRDIEILKNYKVIGVDKSTIYLLHEESGEIREYPVNKYTSRFNNGDTVFIIRFKDREYLVRK